MNFEVCNFPPKNLCRDFVFYFILHKYLVPIHGRSNNILTAANKSSDRLRVFCQNLSHITRFLSCPQKNFDGKCYFRASHPDFCTVDWPAANRRRRQQGMHGAVVEVVKRCGKMYEFVGKVPRCHLVQELPQQ